ncbi:peptide chain release factor N(5)-glutamine methyltransferase [Pseudorhodoplanes sp.]|uniref:peptide chain release factor N(5)-glutamine methyltransferase n=1 Tax=Pseudorhodoplanes sp. TaxID=1934341 RepID=UPI002BE38B46|nr:peptide chain release factor N(5)-glutamine methyltransferase [Pseudorhodoplanes sp.]HWV53469.1 peptide chain release factor N(5)-glutamine methyltransferase [Pseudorhodoplanes sp.]
MSAPDLSAAKDIATARRVLASQFAGAGIDSAALDARLIIGHALSLDHTGLTSAGARALSDAERDAITRLATRRMQGEPVARIIGVKEFWGLPLALSAATLVPRPDTETIVEAALAAIGPARKHEPLRVADLGTGTGAILLALLHEWPNATGLGTDIDPLAIDTARSNAQAVGLAARAQFRLADFSDDLNETFDVVVSNPPYIPTRDIDALDREVRDFDPRRALDGGSDGLDAYRAIAGRVPLLLNSGGVLIVEIGIGQAADVEAIFTAGGWLEVASLRPDLGGVARAVVARPRGS